MLSDSDQSQRNLSAGTPVRSHLWGHAGKNKKSWNKNTFIYYIQGHFNQESGVSNRLALLAFLSEANDAKHRLRTGSG